MRVFVTGASGFVGRWLADELRGAGAEVVASPDQDVLDITDRDGLARWLGASTPPDAVVHLAGMAFAPDARSDAGEAFRVNVGGTVALFEALRLLGIRPAVLVAGSGQVYAAPAPGSPPLTELSPALPPHTYALSKLAQEAVAIESGLRFGIPVVATRSFNHAGPGQRPVFAVPAFARRVVEVARGRARQIPAGNVDVRRDISDVRDVARAYRLLVEAAVAGAIGAPPIVVNVGSGRSVSMRDVLEMMLARVGANAPIEVDPALVRPNDPPEICADVSLLRHLTGWEPRWTLEQTVASVLDEALAGDARGEAGSAAGGIPGR